MASILKVDKIRGTGLDSDSLSIDGSGNLTTTKTLSAPGHVLQVQYTQYTSTTTVSTSANTNHTVDVLSLNITPKSTSSIIRLDAHIFHEWGNINSAHDSMWFFYRDSTKLAHAQVGNRKAGITGTLNSFYSSEAGSTPEAAHYSYFDSPNTTSQITYKVGVINQYTTTLYINRTVTDNDAVDYERGLSFISATEIAQ
jgi:hypothetical protein